MRSAGQRGVLFAALSLVLLATACPGGPETRVAPGGGPIRIAGELSDLLAADVDGDGLDEIVVLAHNYRDHVFQLDARGGVTDVLLPLGLAQDRAFPTSVTTSAPPRGVGGLNVRWEGLELVIDAREASSVVRGIVRAFAQVEIVHGPAKTKRSDSGAFAESSVRFRLHPGRRLVLSFEPAGIPVSFRTQTGPVTVGVPARPAPNRFRLMRRDRHALVLHDLGGADGIGVVLLRGGLKGRAADYPIDLYHEVLASIGDGEPIDLGRRAGLGATCATRQAVTEDLDRDGYLDLYLACGRGQPNEAWLYRPKRRTFVERARSLGLDLAGSGPFIWLGDEPGDRRMLTVIDGRRLVEVVPEPGGVRLRTVTRLREDVGARRFAVGDMDADGDRDVLLVGDRTLLLRAEQEGWSIVPAEDIGLPAALQSASFGDFDGDGRTDLFASPGGLLSWSGDSYERLPGAPSLVPDQATEARAVWVYRSTPYLAIAFRDESGWAMTTTALSTRVAVRLRGPAGDPFGIGARVTATTGSGTRVRWIGDTEASHRSFASTIADLGAYPVGEEIEISVMWRDGSSSKHRLEPTDGLVELSHPDRA